MSTKAKAEPAGRTVSVVVAEDDFSLRDALAVVLEPFEDLDLVGLAGDAKQAIALCQETQPDVALLDLRMPGGGGLRAIRDIAFVSPDTRCLVFSGYGDEDTIRRSLEAGAVGFIGKEASFDELVRHIRDAADADAPGSPGAPKLVSVDGGVPAELARERVGRLLAEGGPRIVFQPIVELESGKVLAEEALSRFDHVEPKRAPLAWFREAEAGGLLRELELAALRSGITVVDDFPPDVRLAVNMSSYTLASYELLEIVEEVPWQRIVIELTDHLADDPALEAAVRVITSRGALVAVDDAGDGHGSMEEILRLSPDLVKIDIGIVRGVDSDPTRQTIVGALVSLAESIGALLVAEGIETEEELETLRDLGVAYGQGFLLGRPGELPTTGSTWRVQVGAA